jgi:hypothetical protein
MPILNVAKKIIRFSNKMGWGNTTSRDAVMGVCKVCGMN